MDNKSSFWSQVTYQRNEPPSRLEIKCEDTIDSIMTKIPPKIAITGACVVSVTIWYGIIKFLLFLGSITWAGLLFADVIYPEAWIKNLKSDQIRLEKELNICRAESLNYPSLCNSIELAIEDNRKRIQRLREDL